MTALFADGVLRGAAAGLLALLAYLFARDWRRTLTARLGALLSIAGIAYLVLPTLSPDQDQAWWRVPIQLMSLSAPGLFWLLAISWFDDEYALRRRDVGVVLTSVALGGIANYAYLVWNVRLLPIGALWRVSAVALIVAGIAVSLRGRGGDLIEARRRVRLTLSLAIGVVILWIVLAELPLNGWPPPLGWRIVNAASLLLLAATLAIGALGWRDPALLAPSAKASHTEPPRSEADDSVLLARLQAEMTRERLYRRDGLTITTVAARLGVPEYRLCRAINQGLGERNFNAYLNGFRLSEVREALADPAQRETPILTIALDAGFGSLAPFGWPRNVPPANIGRPGSSLADRICKFDRLIVKHARRQA